MSGSFESVRWNAYTLTRKSFGGMESEPMLTPRVKPPQPEIQRRIEPAMLHQSGQRVQHKTDRAIPAPTYTDCRAGYVRQKNERGYIPLSLGLSSLCARLFLYTLLFGIPSLSWFFWFILVTAVTRPFCS